jgi:hypothetical protein
LEIDVKVVSEIGYLTTDTRGAASSASKTAIGPAISDTTDRPLRPVRIKEEYGNFASFYGAC